MRLKLVRRGLAILGAIAVVAVVGQGCKQPDSEMFIRGVLLPSQSPACTVQAEADSAQRTIGVLDSSFGSHDYNAPLLVGNQLVARGSDTLVRTETSKVSFTTADVRLEDAAGNELKSYSVPVSGFIDEAQGTTASYGIGSVPLVDGATAVAIAPVGDKVSHRVISKIRLYGQTLGGDTVQSQEFEFIVQVCYGCLISFPSDALVGQYCEGSSASATTAVTPCVTGQDDPVDCRSCANNPACLPPPSP